VRDGLKPVHRRILYTMAQQGITFTAKHRKCAKVVGDVMGNYHPHGDVAIYDALVRMAQPFSLRSPLIDGSGNFGSLDGDPAAAMRYTECRLAAMADELLAEIEQETVHFRPNYDGTRTEPVVLPARFPNLLVNGSTGIAVGMATNIPPHNLGEVCKALLRFLKALAEEREIRVETLLNDIKGPDFPTGGQIINTEEELREVYRTGTGAIRVRATYEVPPAKRGVQTVVITSIPFAINRATLVERIAQVVLARQLPQLVDVRDLSADDVRIELELKRDADAAKVMAYLFRHTPLQSTFSVNLTCLAPTANPEVGAPLDKADLKTLLWHFLNFRLEVVTRRLDHELRQLKRRIHILEGFERVFDALDELIRIIRASDGKADAAQRIMARFPADGRGGGLDAEQTDAILELKLYRLARLEVQVIRRELAERRARARELEALLASEDDRWGLVRGEVEEVYERYGRHDKRRTLIAAAEGEPEFSAQDFIVEEDHQAVLSRDGWIKRQATLRDASSTRLREGDAVQAVVAGSTRSALVFFSNLGVAYTCLMNDIPPSTGYGTPLQTLFKMRDGERIVAAVGLDPRAIGGDIAEPASGDRPPSRHALAATSDGMALRFGLAGFAEPSTRNGRRYARLAEGHECIGVAVITGDEVVVAASRACRVLLCKAAEINYLAGPGRGVTLIKLDGDDRLMGFKPSTGPRDGLRVVTNRGAVKSINTAKYELSARGGRGREVQKHGQLTEVVPQTATEGTLEDDAD
jgi:DNA gyrase subunit A